MGGHTPTKNSTYFVCRVFKNLGMAMKGTPIGFGLFVQDEQSSRFGLLPGNSILHIEDGGAFFSSFFFFHSRGLCMGRIPRGSPNQASETAPKQKHPFKSRGPTKTGGVVAKTSRIKQRSNKSAQFGTRDFHKYTKSMPPPKTPPPKTHTKR